MAVRSVLAALSLLCLVLGCASDQETNQPIAPAAAWAPYGPQQYVPIAGPPGSSPPCCPRVPVAPAPVVVPATAQNCVTTWQTDGKIHVASVFPTGDPATSQVYVELIGPMEIAINQPFDYQIIVKNLTPCSLIDVIVCDTLPTIAQFIKSTPKESKCAGQADGLASCRQDRRLCWDLDTLGPQESKTIDVTAVVKAPGDVVHCVTVDWKRNICLPLSVIETKLQLTKTAPAEVMACEPIPIKLTVSNAGSSVIKNVKVKDSLPSGLATQDGKTSAEFDAGELAQGQSRQFMIAAQASRSGRFVNTATATAAGGISTEASATTVVRAAILEITKSASRSTVFAGQPVVYELSVANKGDGPAKDTVLKDVYLGQNVVFTITVANKGDAPAKDTVIKDVVPAGSSFQSASDGGQLSQNTVTWNIGTLRPDESKKVTLTVRGDEITKVMNTATAEAICAAPVSASAPTEFAGIPAVLLEVIDVEDPVPVGENVTYVIETTNQGSAIDRNIKIVLLFEPNHQYVSSIGATLGTYDANAHSITFDPFPGLLPKAKASWRVIAKAVKAGDVRIKVIMTTEMTTRPVEETESTHFYE